MEKPNILIRNAAQLITCSGFQAKKGADMSEIGLIEDGAVAIADGIIIAVGTTDQVLSQLGTLDYLDIDASNQVVMPGFVDSHTHLVFGGYRADEFEWRLKGDSYMSIMERGGGIASTVKQTREADEGHLYHQAFCRLDDFLGMGVTTVEGKSGYGLDALTEMKQLDVMYKLNRDHEIDLVSTYMGAHAVPDEYKGRTDEYIDYMIEYVMPAIRRENRAEFCDVFCEKGVFSAEQSERILTDARTMGFKLKLHADEIVNTGGAQLAARMGAVSADHLLHISDEGIRQLAASDTLATLLPLTAFSLRESYAPARKLIDAGCAVALASDFNPGSCFSCSMPLLIALACLEMKMTIEEVITALTINGAAALGRATTIGSLDVGKKADLITLKFPSYKFLPYHTGMNCVDTVIKAGELITFDD